MRPGTRLSTANPTKVRGPTHSYDVGLTSYTARALDCNTTYHFRVSARGDGSPYATDYGSPSTGNVSATIRNVYDNCK